MSKHGFTLIEVMIVLPIIAFAMLGLATMFVRVNQQMRASNQQFEFQQLIQGMDSNVRYANTCIPALGGQIFDPSAIVTPVTYTDASGPITAGTGWKDITITSLSLKPVGPIPLAVNQYLADLLISGARTGDIVGPRGMHQSIRLQLTLSATNYITSCFNYSDLTLGRVCAMLLGTFDPATQLCTGLP